MEIKEAFQILLSVFPTLRLTENERQSLIKAYSTVEEALGLKDEKKPNKDAKK